MPIARIPLVGSFTQRTIDASHALAASQDQRFLNCTFRAISNPVTGRSTIYVEKRPGWGVESIVSAGNVSTGVIKTDFLGSAVSAFGSTDSTIFDGQVSVGTITGKALYLSETLISGIGYVLIKSSDGSGWYYPSDSKTQTSYTGDTHSNATINNIASTAGMYSGQLISGSGITAGTRILSVDSSSQITLNANATATASGVTLTKTPIAKILDADFTTTGTKITAFVDMDGYVFYANDDGFLRNSDLNSVTAHTAANKIAANISADPPNSVARHKNTVMCGGHASMEFFFNAGNASGSPLSRMTNAFIRVGTLDQKSVAAFQDDLYLISSARYGDVGVYRVRNFAAQKISSQEVSKILGTVAANNSDIYLSAFQMGGHSYVSAYATGSSEATDLLQLESGEYLLLENGDNFILEASPSANLARMLVYNVELNLWSEWDSDEATFVSGVGFGSVNQAFATSIVKTGGKIYTIKPASDSELHTDDGSTYTMEIRTSRVDFGTDRRKFIHTIRLIADDQASGTVTLEASDDDYKSWVTLGTFDLTAHDKRINRCGSHKGGRAYRLTHSDDAPFRGEALEFTYDEAGT